MTRCHFVLPAALVAALVVAPRATAQIQSWFWTGTTSGSWSTFGNWASGSPPQLSGPPASGATTQLFFGVYGTTGATAMTQDIGAGFQVNELAFQNGPFSLGGSSLDFHVASALGYQPLINMASDSFVTIANSINILDNNLLITGAGTGLLTLNGSISGSNAISNGRTGPLALGGANTFTGGESVYNGATLIVSGDANLGAVPPAPIGNISINGGTLSIAVGFTISPNRTIVTGPNTATLDVAAGQTFVVPGQLLIGTGGLIKTGLGTLTLNGSSGIYGVTVSAGTLQCDVTSVTGTIVDNANVTFNEAANANYAGGLNGTGSLTKIGPATLTLTGANGYQGGTVVAGGFLSFSADNQLGAAGGQVTINNGAAVVFTGAAATTSRILALNSGSLVAGPSANLTLNGALVSGGFLRGSGTFTVTGNTALLGTSSLNSTVVNVTGAGLFANFSNGGALNLTAGAATPTSLNGFINQGSGTLTVGSKSVVNVADFQSYGVVTLTPGTQLQATLLANTGTSPMYFNGGSRTFIGTPATVGLSGAGVDLGGHNLVIAGGLFVNNGFVADSVGGGSVIVDYGGLYKGAGTTFVPIVTQNGGKLMAGNSPGYSVLGELTVGPGAVNSFVWQINDAGPSTTYSHAPGIAGPSADTNFNVSGWSEVQSRIIITPRPPYSTGNLTWTAASVPGKQFNFALETLLGPTTPVGQSPDGLMTDFDPSLRYAWPFITYQGTYTGPTDSATLTADTLIDTSLFANPINGTFTIQLDQTNKAMNLVYTPVPEPGTLVMVGFATVGLAVRRRRISAESTDGLSRSIVGRSSESRSRENSSGT